MSRLIFFDETHSYQVDGEELPSVTEILRFISREIYADVTSWTLDNAADRGKRVHKACENLDRFGSVEIDADIEPYVMAYVAFAREHKPKWTYIERSMFHPDLLYAGTIDRFGELDGKQTVLDIKTSYAIKPVLVAPQLDGYARMLEHDGRPVERVVSLQLKNDGTYKLREHERNDLFMSCLQIHQALKTKRRRKKNGADE